MIPPFLPMLAVPAEPFDSPEHLFEVKWDGVRALACVQHGRRYVWGRELADYTERYPELDMLCSLPAGTVVDGELVVLHEGRADFNALLRRHQLVSHRKIKHASRQTPVSYVLFDMLYDRGQPLFDEPLSKRREALSDLLGRFPHPGLVLSQGIVGAGQAFFDRVIEQDHEGVVAKHLSSRYLPGRRSSTWRKIKPAEAIPCVILGYTPARQGIHSLLVAAHRDGALRYVAELTAGFTDQVKVQLGQLLARGVRRKPVVSCPTRNAIWVEPDHYCQVQFFKWTPNGRLRAARFRGLIAQQQ